MKKAKKINIIITATILIMSLLIIAAATMSAIMADTSTSDNNPEAGTDISFPDNTPMTEDSSPDAEDLATPPVQDTPAFTPAVSSETGPVDREIVESLVLQYMQLITEDDEIELARFLLIDGGVTDLYITIAQRVIEHFAAYDTGNVSVISIDYSIEEQRYTVLARDGHDTEFTVYAIYGDSLLGIDTRMFSGE